jgi:hypothetical protein
MLAGVVSAAEDYPQRAIIFGVPFAVGGASNVLARLASEHMSRSLGPSIAIENVTRRRASTDGGQVRSGSQLRSDRPHAASPAVVVARKRFLAADLREHQPLCRLLRRSLTDVACSTDGRGSGIDFQMSIWAGLFVPRVMSTSLQEH